jgi:hypothetical protein
VEPRFAAVLARFAAAFVTIAGSANMARLSCSGSGSVAITAALRPVFIPFHFNSLAKAQKERFQAQPTGEDGVRLSDE